MPLKRSVLGEILVNQSQLRRFSPMNLRISTTIKHERADAFRRNEEQHPSSQVHLLGGTFRYPTMNNGSAKLPKKPKHKGFRAQAHQTAKEAEPYLASILLLLEILEILSRF